MAEHESEPSAKRRCLDPPISKHTIFLSHSGNEKAFVEQLCEDLKRMNHYPFFDQDSDSLPKGERFPSLIFSAAEQCLLAVVVLSEGYLRSKWPMLELSTFVKSMKGPNPNLKLFPVFYKLSPSDLCAEKVDSQWRESWKKLVQEGKVSAEEIASWSDAVQELRAFNGVEFSTYGTSEVRYRAAVVEGICTNVPPVMKYKTDDIRGYERLCEITSRMFEEGTSGEITCREGCYYLGLYGLGGVGKSTLCKAMCSHFQKEYGSRVCYVELPSDTEERSAEKDRISRVKSILQGLTGLDTRIVDGINSESQGLECLENQLSGQPPVFLAVDNVGDSECSRNEARGLLKSILASGSKVIVSSRSRAILKSIFGEEKYCKPISRLEMHEARELFLSVAAPKKLLCPLQPFEDEIVEACLRECQFVENGYVERQYHPLVLRALGSYFYDIDEDNIMNWKNSLSVENKLQECRESKQVNDIVGLNYSSLSNVEKLVFLDVALLVNKISFRFVKYPIDIANISTEMADYKRRVWFIATLHGISLESVEQKVKKLQRKSLLYEASPTLELHDLYKEFAESLVMKEDSKEREWWVHSKNFVVGMNFDRMKRIFLDDGKGVYKAFYNLHQPWQCEKLECLVMINCDAPKNFSLDLGCLKRLRVLILCGVDKMVEIFCSEKGDGDEGCLPELRYVELDGFNLKRIPFLRECYKLKWLSIKVFTEELVDFIHSLESKVFEKLKAVEGLSLCYHEQLQEIHFERLLDCASSLQSLRFLELELDFGDFEDELWPTPCIDVSPLGGLPMLSTLFLSLQEPIEVQGLNQLYGLTTLSLAYVGGSKLEGVDQLSQLTTLVVGDCQNLRRLPNLDVFSNLRKVCIVGCCSLEDFNCDLENYEEIKHHTYHKCHQPLCHHESCEFCVDRHWRSGVICQVECNICNHVKRNPRGCWRKKYCPTCTRSDIEPGIIGGFT